MKANEAPEKLYLSELIYGTYLYQVPDPDDETAVEYTRKDAFIKKACSWLEAHSPFVNDDILNVWLDNFKEAMKL